MSQSKLTKKQLTKKNAIPASSEDWCMLPDVEELEKIVNRELKKLEENEIANSKKE